MAEVKVISVNPSDQTLGAINTAKLENLARSLRMEESTLSLPGLNSICQFIFGISPLTQNATASKPAFVRIVTASLFALSAFTATASFSAGVPFLIIALAISGMMALGFFERIASFAGFAMLAALIVNSIISTASPLQALESTQTIFFVMMAGGLLAAGIMGPGSASIDKLMSAKLYNWTKTYAARRREQRILRRAEERLSYKAWRSLPLQ